MSPEEATQKQEEAHEVEKGEFEVVAPEGKAEEKGSGDAITVEEAKSEGWTEEEIKFAEEEGMIVNPEEKKKEIEKEEKKTEGKEEEKKVPEQQKAKPVIDDFLLSEEEEAKLKETFGDGSDAPAKLKNAYGLYFSNKSQRARAQAAEAERDRILKENAELKERMDKVEKLKEKVSDDEEEGEEKPLTKKELRIEMAALEAEKEKQKQEAQERISKERVEINERLKVLDDHARVIHEGYDEAIGLARELVERDAAGNFKSEFNITKLPEGARRRAIMLAQQIQNLAPKAHTMTLDAYNVSDMLFDLGSLHPEFGQKQKKREIPAGGESGEGDVGLDPDIEKRVNKNKTRSGSSASISGAGGKRVVTVDTVTQEDLIEMDSATFDKFNRAHPEKVTELMRG